MPIEKEGKGIGRFILIKMGYAWSVVIRKNISTILVYLTNNKESEEIKAVGKDCLLVVIGRR
jgi:hypothetical protein